MSIILKIFGTLIGVSTVMLTCSLIVTCAVRVIQYLANSRGSTLGEMLGALNRGFRAQHSEQAQPGDRAQLAFVHDVLTYPALHDTATLLKLTKPGQAPAKNERSRARAATLVEYLAKEDLLAIVRSQLESAREPVPAPVLGAVPVPVPVLGAAPAPAPFALTSSTTPVTISFADPATSKGSPSADPDDSRVLPERWFEGVPPGQRRFGDFRAYVEHWYKTLEGVSSEQFKAKARRMTFSLSCVLVVFANLDGLQLAQDIFESPDTQAFLSAQAPSILARAEAMGALSPDAAPPVDREQLLPGSNGLLAQSNGILNEPSLRLGWQESPVVKMWCACQKNPGQPCPGFWLGTIRWFAGLVFSCVLLSLGAPFWADMLRKFLNFQNSVKQALNPPVAKGRKDADEAGA